jgi:methylenetetrahydrofolate reductase (NADPH)
LIEGLAKTGRFNLRVGAYPNRHPEAASIDESVTYLKRKLDAGATSAITQFFFEADTFFRFRDACAAQGIAAPIIPGILPVNDWGRVRRFATATGVPIPDWMNEAYRKAARDGREGLLSVALCAELCSTLIAGGVDDLHFYTLNTPELTRDVCAALGITAPAKLAHVA